jgi:large subunit ribosomal protein L13
MILDAKDLIVGRFATVVAKRALLGEDIVIVNSEKAVISGDKKMVIEKYANWRRRGAPLIGPYFPRRPDMVVRRIIRGMLPHKQPKGKVAFQRIQCHIGVPDMYKDKKHDTVEAAHLSRLPNLKYVSIREMCTQLGAK